MAIQIEVEDRVKFIPYRGKKVLELDFSNLGPDDVIALVAAARKTIAAQPPASTLVYCDFTNTPATAEVIVALNEFAIANKPFVKASAAIGLQGPRSKVIETINRLAQRDISVFTDPTKAKNWLIARL
jgi:hypothetical protein